MQSINQGILFMAQFLNGKRHENLYSDPAQPQTRSDGWRNLRNSGQQFGWGHHGVCIYIYTHIYIYIYIYIMYYTYIYIYAYIHAKLLFEIYHRICPGKSRNYRNISWDVSWEYVPTNWSLTLWMDLGLEIIGDTVQVVTELVARLLAGDFPRMICLWVRKHQLTVTFSPTRCYTTWVSAWVSATFFFWQTFATDQSLPSGSLRSLWNMCSMWLV